MALNDELIIAARWALEHPGKTPCVVAALWEDMIEDRGLRRSYVRALWTLLGCGQPGSEEGENVWSNEWALIRATPDQRARAFLEVINGR